MDGLFVHFTEEGEIIVRYPGGIEDRTGIFPSVRDKAVIEAFADTTSGLTLLMRQWNREIRDTLTGLLRRAPGQEMIAEQLRRIGTMPFNGTLSILFIDLNHFGQVNKQYTHAIGDGVLQWVANLLRRYTRTGDVLVRWGGDELVVFTMAGMAPSEREHGRDRNANTPEIRPHTGVTDMNLGNVMNHGKIVANRILGAMKVAPCTVGGVTIPQTATIGVASWLITSGDPMGLENIFDVLLERADTLVGKAKREDQREQVHVAPLLTKPPTP